MVLDVVAGPDVVLTGTGMTEEVPSESVTVLEVMDTAPVPVDEAMTLEAVSLADKAEVVLVSDSTEDSGVLMTDPVADAEDALSVVNWLDSPESSEEAALDRMLEKPSERDSVTAGFVAVAATLEKSELSDEAKLDKAAEASLVIEAVPVVVGLPLASERTDDWAEETAAEKSEAAEDTTPGTPAVSEAATEEVPVESSDSVRTGMGRPPVPRRPPEEEVSVAFVVSVLSAESVDVPRREPTKPGAVVDDAELDAPVPETSGEVDGTILLSDSGVVSGIEAFSALVLASLNDAEDVVEAVPSMMVERPTVIAPREEELVASDTVELFSSELAPVGVGSANGTKPFEPTSEGPSAVAERVVRPPVELTVGETGWAGRRPPDTPASGPKDLLPEEVGSGWLLGTGPVEPTFWLAADELPAVG